MSKTEDRKNYWAEREAKQEEQRSEARAMSEAGYSRKEISEKLGLSESTIRLWI